MVNCRISLLIAVGVSALAARLPAAPISGADAIDTAEAWLLRGTKPAAQARSAKSGASGRMRPAGAPDGHIRTCSLDGTNLFHLVAVDSGGFVTVAADDSMQPILGFASSGDLPDADPANPFWILVGSDAEAAILGNAGTGNRKGGRQRHFDIDDSTVKRNAASAPRKAATNPITQDSGIDDIRIAPLVKSKWNQEKVGSKNVYNYYTPNNYVCGCVATAMAQLMCFHKWPTNEILSQTFTCYTNDFAVSLTMKGGTYDWENMPLVPTSSITEVQREAIGRICYDAGVAMRMEYASGGSSAIPAFAHAVLKDVFGYASAECYSTDTTISSEQTKNGILANLDAGYPVLLGIFGDGGHAILADGYGYANETLYCHLNMGWGGSWDYWYAIPDIQTGNGNFTEIGAVIYNVFPGKTGELVTGRVLDPFGEPFEGATVEATFDYTRTIAYAYTNRFGTISERTSNVVGKATATASTTVSGHYATFLPNSKPDSYRYTVTATGASSDWASTNSSLASFKSSQSPTNVDLDNKTWIIGDINVGNSWGNDLYLSPTNAVAAEFTAFSSDDVGNGFAASFTGTPGAGYRVEWTETLSPADWHVFTNLMIPASGEMLLSLPAPENAASGFFRIVAE